MCALPAYSDDTTRIVELKQLLDSGNLSYSVQIEAANELLALAENDADLRAFSLIERASANFKLDHENALRDLDIVRQTIDERNDEIKAKYYCIDGAHRMHRGDLDLAHESLVKSFDAAKNTNDSTLQVRALFYLCMNARQKGYHILSASYLDFGIELAKRGNLPEWVTRLQINLGQSYIRLKLFEKAEQHLMEIQQQNDYEIDPYSRIRIQTSLAEVETARGDYESALKRLSKVRPVAVKLNSQTFINGIDELKVRCLIRSSNLDEAEEMIGELEKRWSDDQPTPVSNRTFYLTAMDKVDLLMAQGKFDDSLSYINTFLENEKVTLEQNLRLLDRKICCYFMMQEHGKAAEVYIQADQIKSNLRREQAQNAIRITGQLTQSRKAVDEKELKIQEAARVEADLKTARNIQYLITAFSAVFLLSLGMIFYTLNRRKASERENRFKQELIDHKVKLNDELRKQVNELEQKQSERMELEHALNQKRRNEAIGQLTAGVAHDFNNLITVIENSNSLIETVLDNDNETIHQALKTSSEAVRSGADITQRLLAFARPSVLKSKTVTTTELLEVNQPLIQQTLGEGILLSTDNHAIGRKIRVDSSQLTAALINIASNSRYAMNDRGQFSISVSQMSSSDFFSMMQVLSFEATTIPSTTIDSSLIVFSLKDTGTGMDKEQIKRACDAFFTTKPHEDGTGLGLSIVNGFVENSGAGMAIKSGVNQGTEILLAFPEVTHETPLSEIQPADQSDSLKGLRLMLVDDNQLLRTSLKQSLIALDCEVIDFDSGNAAQAALQDRVEVDVLITDIQMPNSINGITLAKWCQEVRPEIAILLISGYHEEKLDSEFAFLPKPFNLSQLSARIRAACQNRQINQT